MIRREIRKKEIVNFRLNKSFDFSLVIHQSLSFPYDIKLFYILNSKSKSNFFKVNFSYFIFLVNSNQETATKF